MVLKSLFQMEFKLNTLVLEVSLIPTLNNSKFLKDNILLNLSGITWIINTFPISFFIRIRAPSRISSRARKQKDFMVMRL